MTGQELYEMADEVIVPWSSMSAPFQRVWDDLAAKVIPIEHDTCPVLKRAESAFKSELARERNLMRGKGDIKAAINAYVQSPHIRSGRPDLAMRAAFKAGLGAEINEVVFDHARNAPVVINDLQMPHPRVWMHDDGLYVSIGFDGGSDTLLKVGGQDGPAGHADVARTNAWVEVVKKLIKR